MALTIALILTWNSKVWVELFPQAILEQTNAFGPSDIPAVIAKLQNYHISIGVKKLLDLLDMVKQVTKLRIENFLWIKKIFNMSKLILKVKSVVPRLVLRKLASSYVLSISNWQVL